MLTFIRSCQFDNSVCCDQKTKSFKFQSGALDVMSSLSPNMVPGLSNVLPTLKKRRKRTNLDNQQKDKLDTYFAVNPRPDHQQMNTIANELDLDPDVSF